MVNKTGKSVEFTKGIFSTQFEYVYCIKHAYKFLLMEQIGFAAVL